VSESSEAQGLHDRGANCAQSVLGAFAGRLGLAAEDALRVATGFGAGMGRMAGACGAVTGAYMVLGLAHGMRAPEDRQAKETVYALVREMARRFRARNGSCVCRELLGVDIGTEAGMAAARAADLFKTRCTAYIRDAAEMVRDILAEHPIQQRSDTHG
jgi:C_GCAxxG_C_C family probable redox protein